MDGEDEARAAGPALPESERGGQPEAARPVISSLVPVPLPEPEPPRRGLWKRLSARRSVRRAMAEAGANEPMLVRLETIEGQLTAVEDSIAKRFDQLNHRFLQWWEIEEQLGQLMEIQERLAQIRESQLEAESRLGALRRAVLWLTAVAALALLLALIGR